MKTFKSNVESGMRMNVSVQCTNMSIQNDNRMDVSVQGQPVLTKRMCLCGEWMYQFGTVTSVPTEQIYLLRMVVPIPIE